MKKILFLLPAIVFTIGTFVFGILLKTFPLLWAAWTLLFWIGGVLLYKERFWGCIFELLPATHMLYMSTQDTGQVINIEAPLGTAVAIYFLICGLIVWVLKKKLNIH